MPRLDAKIITSDKDHYSVLNDIATSLFNARSAIEMRKGEFNIDGGSNDIRAYWNADESCFNFVCRYKRDVDYTSDQIKAYAIVNGLMLSE